MTGIKAFPKKEKRAMRRLNHMTHDVEEIRRKKIINPKRAGKYPDVNDWLIGEDDDYERDSNRRSK